MCISKRRSACVYMYVYIYVCVYSYACSYLCLCTGGVDVYVFARVHTTFKTDYYKSENED